MVVHALPVRITLVLPHTVVTLLQTGVALPQQASCRPCTRRLQGSSRWVCAAATGADELLHRDPRQQEAVPVARHEVRRLLRYFHANTLESSDPATTNSSRGPMKQQLCPWLLSLTKKGARTAKSGATTGYRIPPHNHHVGDYSRP
jgi:hypothetical protein